MWICRHLEMDFARYFFLWQLYYYSVTNLYVTMYVCVNCITVLYLIYKCYMAILMLYGNCMQFLRTVSHFFMPKTGVWSLIHHKRVRLILIAVTYSFHVARTQK